MRPHLPTAYDALWDRVFAVAKYAPPEPAAAADAAAARHPGHSGDGPGWTKRLGRFADLDYWADQVRLQIIASASLHETESGQICVFFSVLRLPFF